ncbi:unnamed protein product [Gadus morhua 'NCC']
MAESHLMGFLVLYLSILPTESTIGILNSINDLKEIPFGQSVPKHSLVLLHWFANAIELSNNNRQKLNFDPNHGDYGAHHYVNVQGFLDPLPFGHRYFTLGNIHFMNNNESRSLPNYYTNDLNYLLVGEELNRARIIFALSSQNTIHRVYITQHYQADQGQGTGYDPEHTYRITINLLRELRVFSLDRREQSELSEIGIYFGSSIGNNELSLLENTWCQLACFGLLFFIVINQRSTMLESHLMGFLVLYLSILPTESTNGILKSINDLKKIPYGRSVPKHSLALLHWFANTIEIDNNDIIALPFVPNNGDYGTHHYGNFDGVLPPGQRYYTLGNINPNNNGNSLPSYVTGQRNHLLGSEELNRARIIFSLLDQDTIDQVFITQHYHASQGQGTVYDPVHTYEISINLLRELREFSLDQNQQSELSEIGTNFGSAINNVELSSIRNKFGQLACVGLLLFIVITERNLPCRPNRARETKRPPKQNVGEPRRPPKHQACELRQRRKRFHTNTERKPNRSTMSESHLMVFLVLLSILPTESTIGILNSMNDLKKIPFGQSVPKHSLVLLHWFADILQMEYIPNLELPFNPYVGHYGTHHYGNFEGVLDRVPFGHRYFTLGNINPNINNNRNSLPSYVMGHLKHLLGREELNRDRIIFSHSYHTNTIGQVFITQHYQANQQRGTVYDPVHTYRITINLLRELREFDLDHITSHSALSELGGDFGSRISDHELSSLTNRLGRFACVGLLLFIVINERNSPCRPNRVPKIRRRIILQSTMPESHLMGFLVLFLSILPTESTIGILNSINDLKKIPFGQSVPKQSLPLLHCFASTIEFDNNDLIELTFEPSNGDYGTHHYGNYEGVLDRLPAGQQYYTLGNINPMINNNGISLPSYVAGHVNHLLGGEELNRARIIFSLLDQDTIDQVFITQHYEANQDLGTGYDPVHTYQITFNLLRVLRVFSLDRRQHSELSEIGGNIGSGITDHELSSVRNTWGQLASTMLESHLMGSLVLLLLILRTESTNGILNSINDLKKIPFGQSVPQHSLVLLHWFANTIEIDNNDAIELTFEPNNGDYGTHHYGNYERVLDRVPSGNQYYTLGNINPMINNNRNSLPSYVVGDLNHLLGREELNRARIIFSHHILAHTTHQVFITQHYEVNQNRGSGYDPGHTYQITIDLLRELRVLSSDRREQSELSEIGGNFGSAIDSNELSSIRNKFGQLACVGLLLFIVINERNLPCRPNRAREPKRPPKRILNSINDLKKIPFGQSVPQHSLVLLHWFANTIEINNDTIVLTFEPDHGDYGTHHYRNYETVLNPLPFGQQYYTLGNINPMVNNDGNSLPSYFTGRLDDLLGGEELNRARIIFSLLDQNTISQVFITQHYEANQGQGTVYDPEHTYQISINLLRELRVFSLDRREQSDLSEIGSNIGSGINDHELSSNTIDQVSEVTGGDFGSSINNYKLSSVRNTWGQLALTMAESHLMGFVVLFLSILPTESSIGILNSINDLKKIPFGQSVPKHSLVLLHWFANTIEIDNNDAIELTFEPNHGDYGIRRYGNFEGFLDPLPFGHRYYTLGNINPMFNNQRRLTMSEIHLMGYLVLFLSILPTASSFGILKSINDLKKIPFGQSVPKHSLALLHWFANTIGFDNNDLIELNFEPDDGDYGTHHYGNYEGFLDPVPYRHRYFTLGNINPNINNQRRSLPSYFTNNDLFEYEELNRARIIFTFSYQNTIGRVYITQHYQNYQGQGTLYDPEHTYRITINLLRELRVFSVDRRSPSELSEIGGDFESGIDDNNICIISNSPHGSASELEMLPLGV